MGDDNTVSGAYKGGSTGDALTGQSEFRFTYSSNLLSLVLMKGHAHTTGAGVGVLGENTRSSGLGAGAGAAGAGLAGGAIGGAYAGGSANDGLTGQSKYSQAISMISALICQALLRLPALVSDPSAKTPTTLLEPPLSLQPLVVHRPKLVSDPLAELVVTTRPTNPSPSPSPTLTLTLVLLLVPPVLELVQVLPVSPDPNLEVTPTRHWLRMV